MLTSEKKLLIGAGLIAALTMGGFFTVLAQAEPGNRGERGGPPRMQDRDGHRGMMGPLRELNLSDDQKEQIREILGQHRGEMEPLTEKLATERKALRELIHADPINESAIHAQAAKVGAAEGDLAVARAKIGQQIRAVLTPEQVAQLETMREKFEAKAGEFRGRLRERARDRLEAPPPEE